MLSLSLSLTLSHIHYLGLLCTCWSLHHHYLIILHNVAGTADVVVGDLVYCKEHDTEMGKEIATAEREDENSNDILDSHDLEEISGTDLPEEQKNSVKVCNVFLAPY